ncbi:hypothetical protein CTRI78_v006737 [Colletotrichum trifolii]|uniref:BZIP domain-containing protein n=1 Tax=Colletotrichum trifolii TaxID=5466 RepID=A0A4R8RMM8_COLTR|nr:hypothetical protein CTRI78_v006737 [Colletotrichum trifolii]
MPRKVSRTSQLAQLSLTLEQNKTAASIAENRDAQRKSRARRQELVADLQRRLDEYERMGVSASIEMQRVAQAVNVQNQRLKSLLGAYGVSGDEIERHLSSPVGGHPALNARHRCITCGRYSPGIPQTIAMSMDDPSQSSLGSATSMARDTVPMLASVLSNPTLPTSAGKQPASAEPPVGSMLTLQGINEGVSGLPAEEHGSHHQMHAANRLDDTTTESSPAPTDTLPPLSDSFDSSDAVIRHSNHSASLETSCDEAAKILAELHSHADSSWARSALGCHGDSSCSVKNTRIFQLMDHPFAGLAPSWE